MSRTRIKICGVTRPEDAALAARHGADAVGVVCYPQARRYSPIDRARAIVRALPAFVSPVALFVDQSVDEVREVASALGVRHLQLHGHETPEMVATLREFVVLKALRAGRDTLAGDLARWREAGRALDLSNLQGLVLETAATTAPGGTGVENDWATIAEIQERGAFAGLPPIVAAGGLRPENVAAVVRRLGPYAVDVSSGVEEAFGQKSEGKVAAFVREVRGADDV